MPTLSQRVRVIEERNRRVELDKAWETSWTRKIVIACLTYIVILLFFIAANVERPYLSALIPTLGFVLSTFSLPFFKRIWIMKRG